MGVDRRKVDLEEFHEEEECQVTSYLLNKLVEKPSSGRKVSGALAWDDLTGMSLDAGKVKEARAKEVAAFWRERAGAMKEIADKVIGWESAVKELAEARQPTPQVRATARLSPGTSPPSSHHRPAHTTPLAAAGQDLVTAGKEEPQACRDPDPMGPGRWRRHR